MSHLTATLARTSRIAWGLGLAFLVVAPFVGVYPIFMMNALCFAMFACAFNLLLGFTGLLSFGHAAYLAAAAYTTGWLVRSAGWSPEAGVVAGVAIGAPRGPRGRPIAMRPPGRNFARMTQARGPMG